MEQATPQFVSRRKERLFLVTIALLLGLLFLQLYQVHQQSFADVDKRLQDGTMVNLNARDPAGNFSRLLQKGFYFDDPKDIELIGSVVRKQITGTAFDNIGDLNKSKFNVDADEAFIAGGKSFKDRVLVSRALLGYTGNDSSRFSQEKTDPPKLPEKTDVGLSGYGISGKVLDKGNPVPGVLIRLQMIIPQDSTFSDEEADETKTRTAKGEGYEITYIKDEQGQSHLQAITAFARTGENGDYAFSNLPAGKAFSILPLQPGYQFGRSNGTESLDQDETFNFIRSAHTIRLLSTRDFSILKKEKALIIRTPSEFNFWYLIIVVTFFLCFSMMHVLLSRRFPGSDQTILPLIMILTGISFLMLLSIQDPLRDRFFAKDSLVYLVLGFVAMVVLLFCNIRRFNTDSGIYRL